MSRFFRLLVGLSAALAFVVVVVGGYVRLSDAGLGCPDWPLCYGHPLPNDIAAADGLAKAWKEMGHRYLAGTLGLLILAIAVITIRRRRFTFLGVAIGALVVLQASLGMWTVTLLLKPAIVAAHLLGGLSTLALLIWLFLEQGRYAPAPGVGSLRLPAALALAVLAVQIALGGWVSANYAALACPDLPGCMGQAVPPMDFRNAFHIVRDLGRTSEGELLSLPALTAIHWTHRMFALVAFAVIGVAGIRTVIQGDLRLVGAAILCLLLLQVSLGIGNVAFGLPLPLAAAHNAGAALLLASLVVLNFFVFRRLRPSS